MIVLFQIDATAQQEAVFYCFLRDQLHKPYDHLAILGFLWNRNWRDDDAWYCSELVAAALEEARISPKSLYLPANKITPVTLAVLVSELPNAKELT